jgi:hypothetical protein
MKNLHKTLAIVAIIATLTTGCRSTKDYKKLVEAGNRYAQAVDQLLVTAGNMKVDDTSEELLNSRMLLSIKGPLSQEDSELLENNYRTLSKGDKERLETLSELRAHNQLLQDYFSKLKELATSDAPDKARTEAQGIVGNLTTIGANLKKRLPNLDVLPGITSLVIDSKIRGVLREELEQNNQKILEELTIQQAMLKEVSREMEDALKHTTRLQEERLIIQPFIKPDAISDEESWITTRRKILLKFTMILALKRASEALGKFQEVFQQSLEGKLTTEHLNDVLKTIDLYLSGILVKE